MNSVNLWVWRADALRCWVAGAGDDSRSSICREQMKACLSSTEELCISERIKQYIEFLLLRFFT